MKLGQTGGLSKGCMIGLIIGIIVVVLVAIGIFLVYFYMDDLAKTGANAIVQQVKTTIVNEAAEGVDTARFNAVADPFMAKLAEDTATSAEDLQYMLMQAQTVLEDEKVDSAEIETLITSMITIYPELVDRLPKMIEEPDSLMMEEETLTTE